MEDSVLRVTYFEGLMDEIKGVISSEPASALKLQQIQAPFGELRKYYSSLDWMNDFEADEAGSFPADLKRGVLSEDGVDHLFDDLRDWASQIIDNLMEMPYWIVDILPEQVPEGSKGQYFNVERFFLDEPNIYEIRRKYADILLKVNCYFPVLVSYSDISAWHLNPDPADLSGWIIENSSDRGVLVIIPEEETLLAIRKDDTYMTIYNPSERLLDLLNKLSQAEGLFVWKNEV